MRTGLGIVGRLLGLSSLCLLTAALAGCGSSGDEAGYTPGSAEVLREVWTMYKCHLDERRWAPTQLADLEPYEPAAVHGYGALRDGEVVLFWGRTTRPAAAGRLLAYEKRVPEQGGAVLYDDGIVGQMSSAEFTATVGVR
jgi:hypothetical protein